MESSDINDGDILNNTRIVGGKFTYTMPSGRILTSEVVSDENRKKAVPIWLATVREQIVQDTQDSLAKAQRINRFPELETELPSTPPATTSSSSVSSAAPVTVGVPTLHPKNAREYARVQRDYWEGEVKRLKCSEIEFLHWDTIVKQLGDSQ